MLTTRKYTLLCLIMVTLALSGCNPVKKIQTSELTGTFDRTFKVYRKHLRWSHFRELTSFMTQEHVLPSLAQIELLSDIKVSRVTPMAWVLNYEEGVMTGDVVIDYYITSTSTIRSTTQNQTWLHDSESGAWQLDNGLPKF